MSGNFSHIRLMFVYLLFFSITTQAQKDVIQAEFKGPTEQFYKGMLNALLERDIEKYIKPSIFFFQIDVSAASTIDSVHEITGQENELTRLLIRSIKNLSAEWTNYSGKKQAIVLPYVLLVENDNKPERNAMFIPMRKPSGKEGILGPCILLAPLYSTYYPSSHSYKRTPNLYSNFPASAAGIH